MRPQYLTYEIHILPMLFQVEVTENYPYCKMPLTAALEELGNMTLITTDKRWVRVCWNVQCVT